MSPKRILVIDDDQMIINLTRMTLEQAGFDVIQALSGRDGLTAFKEQKPVLLIVDIAMPGMDGYELIETIRKSGEPGTSIPIMIVSAHQQDVMRDYAKELGVNLYLVKPVRPQHLIEHVQRLLDGVSGS